MNEFLQQFLVESRELAEQATAGLLSLERAPRDAAQLDAVFRALHTLKGGAGIVEFVAMERALHAAEDLLAAARAGRRVLDPTMAGDLLACLDQLVQWLDVLEQTGELPAAGTAEQAQRIVATLQRHRVDEQPDTSAAAAAPSASSGASAQLPDVARELLVAQIALLDLPSSSLVPGHVRSAARSAANVLHACGREGVARELASLGQAGSAGPQLRDLLVAQLDSGTIAANAGYSASAAPRADAAAARTVRIDAERVDALVRLAGELGVAGNALAHLARIAAQAGNPLADALNSRNEVFGHLIGELQRAVLFLRVLPLRTVFQRFPRLLREMADELGKTVELRFAGEETEADKAIVEMLFEPLLHVLRNAVDHGVETAARRAAAGKPLLSTLWIRASRQGDQVLVEVEDDGAGIDTQRIRPAALARGVADAAVLEAMDEEQIRDLVFAPGFSTAAAVTALSGRGVGMDAVRTAVARVGGRVSLQSRPGAGTTVRFTLPFSVMVTSVVSVESGGQTFGVPLDSVLETIRVPRSSLGAVGAARAVVLRDQTIPVLDLAQVLGNAPSGERSADATIVIASCSGQPCGLDVEKVGERLEVILKPLDGLLTGMRGIAGTTVLGDGRVLLVLDVGELL